MITILMALIVFVALLIVGYPLVNPQRYQYAESGVNGDDPLETLAGSRNSIFDAIRDLEFDHATGKLSEGDYRQMRARYDVKAAEILQKMDALSAPKKTGGSSSGVRAKSDSGKRSCTRCHSRVEPSDRFCQVCGAALS